MSRVIVIIPTYNEVENIALIATEVLAQDDRIEVLVVDDNSPDGTGKVVDELR
ncbi:MAG: glycosyltransferase, partial [Myxococcota bacterium]|nr:glycosyltransferase [Myxococcota bacterium]